MTFHDITYYNILQLGYFVTWNLDISWFHDISSQRAAQKPWSRTASQSSAAWVARFKVSLYSGYFLGETKNTVNKKHQTEQIWTIYIEHIWTTFLQPQKWHLPLPPLRGHTWDLLGYPTCWGGFHFLLYNAKNSFSWRSLIQQKNLRSGLASSEKFFFILRCVMMCLKLWLSGDTSIVYFLILFFYTVVYILIINYFYISRYCCPGRGHCMFRNQEVS